MSRPRLSTLSQHLERHGLSSVVWLLLLQPLENWRILRIGRIHVSSTAAPSTLPSLPRYQIQARFLEAHEIRPLAAEGANWFFPQAVECSLVRGERCFGLFVDGQLATSIWYSPGPLKQFGLELEAIPRSVFAHRRFTNPEWRGKGLAPLAAVYGRALLREEGIDRTIGTIYATNTSSIRASTKSGSRCIGWIVQIGPDRLGWSILIPKRTGDPQIPKILRRTG